MKTQLKAKLLLTLSMAIFGTLAPFVRNIPISSGELALGRAVLAVILIGIALPLTGQKLSLHTIKKSSSLPLDLGHGNGL